MDAAATRRRIVAGNWKMNTTLDDAVALAQGVAEAVGPQAPVDVVLIPPAPFLADVHRAVQGADVQVGAQNLHPAEGGAYTGELSGAMLRSAGCSYVICGHSERRKYFAETPEWVGEKVAAAHRAGLTPILCVGETLAERDGGRMRAIVAQQLDGGLGRLTPEDVAGTVLAYEPVWAIGTGRTATPEQAQEVHAFLRARLASRYGDEIAAAVRIQYGGSVKPGNAAELLGQPDIDGALVGGASLKADSFAAIVRA